MEELYKELSVIWGNLPSFIVFQHMPIHYEEQLITKWNEWKSHISKEGLKEIRDLIDELVPDEYLEDFFVYGLNQMKSSTGRRISNITRTFMERYEGFTNPSESELEEMVREMNNAFDLNKVLSALSVFDVLGNY